MPETGRENANAAVYGTFSENARGTKPKAVSIFIIGTELTCGIIQDRHIPLLAGELTKLGYSIHRASIVPDDGSISHELEHAVSDSGVIIVTGGLGPTCDDMTRQAIADLAGVPLERNETAWNEVYARLGDRIWGANERQAYIPRGFDEIPNPKGTAPGFKGSFSVKANPTDGSKTDVSEPSVSHEVLVVAMPGPPSEMQYMFYNHVRPFFARISGCEDLRRDEFSVYMVPEAKLEDLCEACAVDGVSWGTRFQPFKISLYVDGGCEESRKEFEAKLSSVMGRGLLEKGEHEAVDLLSSYLEENGLTISTAESATAGFASKLLTDRSGSSSWFWGGAATYANAAKAGILGVDASMLEDPAVGPVSEQCAKQMADGMRRLSGSSIAVSITGIAGPGGAEDGKPVGTAYIGLSSSIRDTEAVRVNVSANSRDSVRRKFAVAMMLLALEYAKGGSVVDMASSWVYI